MDTQSTLNLTYELQNYMFIILAIIIILVILIITLFVKTNALKSFNNNLKESFDKEAHEKQESIIRINQTLNKIPIDINEKIASINSNFENFKLRLQEIEKKLNDSLTNATQSANIENDKDIHNAKIARMNEVYQHLINDKYIITNSLFAVNEMVKILLQLLSEDNEEEWDLTKKNIENILLFIDQKKLLSDFTDPSAIILQNSGIKSETENPKILERYGQD